MNGLQGGTQGGRRVCKGRDAGREAGRDAGLHGRGVGWDAGRNVGKAAGCYGRDAGLRGRDTRRDVGKDAGLHGRDAGKDARWDAGWAATLHRLLGYSEDAAGEEGWGVTRLARGPQRWGTARREPSISFPARALVLLLILAVQTARLRRVWGPILPPRWPLGKRLGLAHRASQRQG